MGYPIPYVYHSVVSANHWRECILPVKGKREITQFLGNTGEHNEWCLEYFVYVINIVQTQDRKPRK